RTGPSRSCDRQLRRPGRLARHQMGEFLAAAEAVRYFADNLVMHVKHNRIASGFNPQHCFSQQITGDSGDNIFSPNAAVRAVAVTAVLELPGSVVREDNNLIPRVFDLNVGLRVSEFAAARQLQEQKCAAAFEGDTATGDYTAALAHRSPCGPINVVPEPLNVRMRSAPFLFELLHFFISEFLGLEFAPGV